LKRFPHASDVNSEQMSPAARQTASIVRAAYFWKCALSFENAYSIRVRPRACFLRHPQARRRSAPLEV